MEPEQFRQTFLRLKTEIQKVIVGYEALIEEVLTALVAGGHVLLEGVPGLGKTLLVKTLAQALELHYSRIQFTPDLMPADIIGTNVVMQDEAGRRFFEFQRGPIFSQIVLADEINRATPKTQSALLEAMQEHAVTVAGVHYTLEEPFFVLATQNPIEMEGTYPLPEAQVDRFLFKLRVLFPALDDLVKIMDRTTGPELPAVERVTSGATILAMQTLAREVAVAAHVKDYVARVVRATHPEGEGTASMAKRFVRYGASPRGAQALLLAAKVRALLAGRGNGRLAGLRAGRRPRRHRRQRPGGAPGVDPGAPVRGQRLLDPKFLRKLETLSLRSRRIVRSGMRGERRSSTLGRGVEFADYRRYPAGDDYRYIDWNIYSPLDRLFVKLFSEEEDINVHLLIDRSRSMAFPPTPLPPAPPGTHGHPAKLLY